MRGAETLEVAASEVNDVRTLQSTQQQLQRMVNKAAATERDSASSTL